MTEHCKALANYLLTCVSNCLNCICCGENRRRRRPPRPQQALFLYERFRVESQSCWVNCNVLPIPAKTNSEAEQLGGGMKLDVCE